MEFGALAAAGRQDLVRLADLLEAGLLTPPPSALSLRDHIGAAHAAPLAQCCCFLHSLGPSLTVCGLNLADLGTCLPPIH